MRLIGLDPGLRHTGWGVIDVDANRLSHVANGVVGSDQSLDLTKRLVQLHEALRRVLETYGPVEAAVEASLVNKNPTSSLKLGVARGAILLAPGLAGLPVTEYLPNVVKKAVVGTGHAAKDQIQAMVRHLLPGVIVESPDAADALAVAICHSHYAETRRRWSAAQDGNETAAARAAVPPAQGAGT
jgi:crossover junction endodeoxyribonuclease RuvC